MRTLYIRFPTKSIANDFEQNDRILEVTSERYDDMSLYRK